MHVDAPPGRPFSPRRSLEPKRPPKPLYGVWNEAVGDEVIQTPSDEALKLLQKRGYLTRRSVKEEEAFFKQIARRIHAKGVRRNPSFVLMPTYNCNLRCHYCFQDYMRNDPAFQPMLRPMSKQRVDLIFQSIPKIEAMHQAEYGEGDKRSFTLFGGEPLLARHRSIVEYILNKMTSLGPAHIFTVSNATELDAYDAFLGPELLSSIQITLDGRPEEHDRRRIYPDGSGSFQRIAGNIDLALSKKVRIDVRLNLDRNNFGDLPAIVSIVKDHGWHEQPNFSIYTAPIRADKKGPELMDAWEMTQELERLKQENPELEILGLPDDPLRNRAGQMFANPGKMAFNMKPVYCSAHDRMYIFDAIGDIYACWEKTGDARIRLGHIAEDGELKLNVPANMEWRTRTVASNPVCSRCRYALHCGGGCAVLAQGRTGKLHANFCDGYAARFRSALAETYLKSEMAAASACS